MLDLFEMFLNYAGTATFIGAYGLALFHIIPFQGNVFYLLSFCGAIALTLDASLFDRGRTTNSIFFLMWTILTGLVYFNPFHWHF